LTGPNTAHIGEVILYEKINNLKHFLLKSQVSRYSIDFSGVVEKNRPVVVDDNHHYVVANDSYHTVLVDDNRYLVLVDCNNHPVDIVVVDKVVVNPLNDE
jgi:hypothetical protein